METLVVIAVIGAIIMLLQVRTHRALQRGNQKVLESSNTLSLPPAPATLQCPYCHVDVIGESDLDILNHLSCITKSKEDILQDKAERLRLEGEKRAEDERKAAERKEAEALRRANPTLDKKYKIVLTPQKLNTTITPKNVRNQLSNPEQYHYDEVLKVYMRWHWSVKRKSESVGYGYAPTKEEAEEQAQRAVEIDKIGQEHITV